MVREEEKKRLGLPEAADAALSARPAGQGVTAGGRDQTTAAAVSEGAGGRATAAGGEGKNDGGGGAAPGTADGACGGLADCPQQRKRKVCPSVRMTVVVVDMIV